MMKSSYINKKVKLIKIKLLYSSNISIAAAPSILFAINF